MSAPATALVPRDFQGHVIHQRQSDRYLNATAMCKAAGKRWNDYHRLASTQEFIEALSATAGIPAVGLIASREGRPDLGGGTWVHPHVAIHLAQWLSPLFAVHVVGWVEELLLTGRVQIAPSTTPSQLHAWGSRFSSHILRFRRELRLQHPGSWAVACEIMDEVLVIEDELVQASFPTQGTDLPDGSVGKMWRKFREGRMWAGQPVKGLVLTTPNPDCPEVQPWLYPDSERPHFHRWLYGIYLPVHMPIYLARKARADRHKWIEAGLPLPALPAVARAMDNACQRLAGQPAHLPPALRAAVPELPLPPDAGGHRQRNIFEPPE